MGDVVNNKSQERVPNFPRGPWNAVIEEEIKF